MEKLLRIMLIFGIVGLLFGLTAVSAYHQGGFSYRGSYGSSYNSYGNNNYGGYRPTSNFGYSRGYSRPALFSYGRTMSFSTYRQSNWGWSGRGYNSRSNYW